MAGGGRRGPARAEAGALPPIGVWEVHLHAALVLHASKVFYQRYGNGVFAWRAWKAARQLGTAPPDWVVTYLDRVAGRLGTAGHDLGTALDIRVVNGGRSLEKRAARLEFKFFVWVAVQDCRQFRGMNARAAFAAVADIVGRSSDWVRRTYYDVSRELAGIPGNTPTCD